MRATEYGGASIVILLRFENPFSLNNHFLSPNFCFNFPKKPLFLFSFLSVPELAAGDATSLLAPGFDVVGCEVCGTELEPSPVATIGCVCDPAGRVMGETSLESTDCLVAFAAAGVVAGTEAEVEAGGSERADVVLVVVDLGSGVSRVGGCVEVLVDSFGWASVGVSGVAELLVAAGANPVSAALAVGAGSPAASSG